jgi:Glycosyl hydrolase family 115/Gylcosyl hydrolase family 115 C-terminal domain
MPKAAMRDAAALAALAVLTAPAGLVALGHPAIVDSAPSPGAFPLVSARGEAADLYVDDDDWPGLARAVSDLRADVLRVTDAAPEIRRSPIHRSPHMTIVGTIGRSRLVDELIDAGLVDVSDVRGRWESYVLQTVTRPFPGVDSALVIAGSDKRGAIYGVYELSEQIGVSPWHWWADVAPAPREALYVRAGRYPQGEPAVRYRGIFLNDEQPNLDRWVRATYGEHPSPGDPAATVANFNREFYGRIFETLLRMRGNTLWPAMWNNAFAEDDADNARLADEYGIVMGTSHQEPMLRAQKEWDWHLGRTLGNWNFALHEAQLTEFWRQGVRRRAALENLYTLGLRGENDTEMVQGRDESIRLLDRIVDLQRRILAEEVDADVTNVPQVWTLYKEVQGYYAAGLRVPDDVTLLWADDNWGNVRRVPTAEERRRAGGAGVYYHLDYHGGPRSYQWLDTNPIARIWDQMTLALDHGADRIWILNVGHFKSYAFPMEYFLTLAWDGDEWGPEDLRRYTELWAAREFGAAVAPEVAEIVATTTRYSGRRKPELLAPDTYSLVHFREAERVVEDYRALVARARAIETRLPGPQRDAFFELVLYPALAAAQVNELYVAAGRNALYAEQGRATANAEADRVRELFAADRALAAHFNHELVGGRWNHFADQPHLGYTSWRDPPTDSLDAIALRQLDVPAAAGLGVAVEGDRRGCPCATPGPLRLPELDAVARRPRFIDVFDRGREPFTATVTASEPWIVASSPGGSVGGAAGDLRVWISIDWDRAPVGRARGTVRIAGAGEEVSVEVPAHNPTPVTRDSLRGFAEGQGVVAMEAEHFTRRENRGDNRWVRVEDYGRTLSGMRAEGLVDALGATPGIDSPTLDYTMYVFTPGRITADLVLGPTLPFVPGRGMRLAASFDAAAPEIVEVVPAGYDAANGNLDWERTVMDNARTVRVAHDIEDPGYHTLHLWMVDPGVVVQRILVRTPAAADAPTYLGPPESFRNQPGITPRGAAARRAGSPPGGSRTATRSSPR